MEFSDVLAIQYICLVPFWRILNVERQKSETLQFPARPCAICGTCDGHADCLWRLPECDAGHVHDTDPPAEQKELDGDESGIEIRNPIHLLSCLSAYSYVGVLVIDGQRRVHQTQVLLQ